MQCTAPQSCLGSGSQAKVAAFANAEQTQQHDGDVEYSWVAH